MVDVGTRGKLRQAEGKELCGVQEHEPLTDLLFVNTALLNVAQEVSVKDSADGLVVENLWFC